MIDGEVGLAKHSSGVGVPTRFCVACKNATSEARDSERAAGCAVRGMLRRTARFPTMRSDREVQTEWLPPGGLDG